jgi:hypothetical protein
MIRRWPCIVFALLCLLSIACGRTEEPKPLAERWLDLMIKRCRQMVRTDQQGACENPPGNTTREATINLHRIMVTHVTDIFRRDGVCSKHALYLVCTETMLDGTTRHVLYRLNDAKDGSDSRVMFVWSQEW